MIRSDGAARDIRNAAAPRRRRGGHRRGCTAAMTAALALTLMSARAAVPAGTEAWTVFETSFETGKRYDNPFTDVEVDVVFTSGGNRWTIPAFWAGGNVWKVRFAPPAAGEYRFRPRSNDAGNDDFGGAERTLVVAPYSGDNPLLRHGFLRIAADRRHFEHADGTPFLWLGDTWWKCLCKRMPFDDFRELTADRRNKGFNVVQIVCGPYPDEGPWEDRWENEGGKPYETRDFSVVNQRYFEFADRRIRHLVDAGMVPAIVGGWGRGDCNGMALAGLAGIKRHWRNLVARYGCFPTVWIVGGESDGPQWTEVARLVKALDAYDRPRTMHPHQSGRLSVTDESTINFDMLQTGHGDMQAARGAIPKLGAALGRTPPMPVMIGEFCYEGHMQQAYDDAQRYVFWGSMLGGAAGLTYGAAGIWHASVEGDPGLNRVYDLTTWREGRDLPGSGQIGAGKRLLERYAWAALEPHPEWADPGCFAAGIPGELRIIYQPRRGVYDWQGVVVRGLEPGVPYKASYFDPIRGRRHDAGAFAGAAPPPSPFAGHRGNVIAADAFADRGAVWRDHGTPTRRGDGRLSGGKGLVTTIDGVDEADAMVSVDANADAEAGVMLRYHDADNYLVALYSPSLKSIFLHDRRDGHYGEPLGAVAVPEIGPRFTLTAAATGDRAALTITDGTRAYWTPVVTVRNHDRGRVGLWFFQIGNRQEFGDFRVSRTAIEPPAAGPGEAGTLPPGVASVPAAAHRAAPLPCPQDWVLVLERVKP